MNLRFVQRTLFYACLLSAAGSLSLTPSVTQAVSFGNVATWVAAPNSTIGLANANFVWLGDSGNWLGTENVNLSYFPLPDAYTFGIDALEDYVGPLTLSVAYRVDITSNKLFSAVLLDQDILVPGVTTTKDIYGSLTELETFTAPGSGTVTSLSIVDFTPFPNPPVALPPVQSLWVRDTIQIASGVGVQSISNTFFQVVPEPGSGLLAAMGVGVTALTLRRSGRRGRVLSRPARPGC